MMSLDETLAKLRGVLSAEQDQQRITGLTDLTAHKIRRAAMKKYLSYI